MHIVGIDNCFLQYTCRWYHIIIVNRILNFFDSYYKADKIDFCDLLLLPLLVIQCHWLPLIILGTVIILIEATLVQSYISIVWTRVGSSFDSILMTRVIIIHVITHCCDNELFPNQERLLLLINNNIQIYNRYNIPFKNIKLMINKI